jgi:hypothetical protein
LTTVGGGHWVQTDQMLGYQPDDAVTVSDEANFWNANFQYVGTDNGVAGPQSLVGSTLAPDPMMHQDGYVGLVSIASTLGPSILTLQLFSGQDFNVGTNKDASNQSYVVGPDPSLLVPEPNTGILAVVLDGALVLAILRRRGLPI